MGSWQNPQRPQLEYNIHYPYSKPTWPPPTCSLIFCPGSGKGVSSGVLPLSAHCFWSHCHGTIVQLGEEEDRRVSSFPSTLTSPPLTLKLCASSPRLWENELIFALRDFLVASSCCKWFFTVCRCCSTSCFTLESTWASSRSRCKESLCKRMYTLTMLLPGSPAGYITSGMKLGFYRAEIMQCTFRITSDYTQLQSVT